MRDYYASILTESEPRYILGKIEMLQSRYFEKPLDEITQEQLDREWIADLREYPKDLIDKACQDWRRADNSYAPASAGVLAASVKDEFIRRKSLYRKACDVIALCQPKEGAA